MRRAWLVTALCVHAMIAQNASVASSSFPNFPTIDDPRVVVGDRFNPLDDINDDTPAAPIQITHMRVRSEIAMRYARTAIISNVYNPSKRPQEATFHVLLPETAFISGFTMTLGKETYDAYVKEKEEAKQIYNDAVAQGVSAAHVATKPRDSNHFAIKFNLEGRSNATYRLRYEEFLVRRNGVYNHAVNLLPGALVPVMDVVVHIKESQKISVLRVPEVRTGNEIDATEKDAQNTKAVVRKGKNGREATITFTPDLAEQTRLAEIYAEKIKRSNDPDSSNIGYDSAEDENEKEGLLGQFVVQYDMEQPKNGEILVNDGYFVHFFAPTSLPPLSKHAVFVLDTSVSMLGTKIEQLRNAMDAILSDLKPNDYFSIIEFNTYITVHDLKEVHDSRPLYHSLNNNTPEKIVPPALASPENIASAKTIVSRFIANGGTNIYEALDVALNIIQNGIHVENHTDTANMSAEYNSGMNVTDHNENDLQPIIIFLTDGEPTWAELSTDRIISHISEKNKGLKRAPLYSLAFGDDADRVFLRKLSLRNEGFMRHVYEAADAALQLHDFYRQVSSPLLADVKFLYPRRQIKEGSVSRSEFPTINDGSEVAVVGRIAENVNELTPQVRAIRAELEGRRRKLYEVNPKVSVTPAKDEHLPLERLWAYLTIKQLLDKRDAEDVSQSDTEDSPEKKALDIALKYSFVTPLTSLVVVRLNVTDAVDAVNAETVDDPRFLPYTLAKPSPDQHGTQAAHTYRGISTGEKLSLSSNIGPVLFAVSNSDDSTRRSVRAKRFATGAYSSHSSSYGSSPSSGYGSSLSSGYGSSISSGYNSYHSSGQCNSYGSIACGQANGDTNSQHYYILTGHGTSPPDLTQYRPLPEYQPPPLATRPPSLPTPPPPLTIAQMYHLEGYEWVLGFLLNNEDVLRFWDVSGQVILKFSKDVNPPRSDEGDYPCQSREPAASQETGLLCVYLTRCFAARNYTFTDYFHKYCGVSYDGSLYAGVCCPPSEIDKYVPAITSSTTTTLL